MIVSVFGCGSIGQRHLKNLDKIRDELGIKVLKCYDEDASKTNEFKNTTSQLEVCNNIEDAAVNCDIAFICVPTSLHISLINQIFNYGVPHLYLEKPFSHNLNGCEDIIFKMKRENKYLSVGYMLPNHPVLKELKKLLDENIIGKPLTARAESGFYLPLWHPLEDYRNFYMSWKSGGGGALLDTSHEINYLQFLFGEVYEVSGDVFTISELEITSDDLALGTLYFKNGVIGQIHLDLLQYEEERYCKIVGTSGVVIASLVKNEIKIFTFEKKAWEVKKIEVNFDDIYFMQLRKLWESINDNKNLLIDGVEAFNTMQVVEGIRISSSHGLRVKLPIL